MAWKLKNIPSHIRKRMNLPETIEPKKAGRFGKSSAGKREVAGKTYFFRSMWEANYSRYLQYLQENGVITRWEFEPQTFFFPQKTGTNSYLPDFKVYYPESGYEWHEVKGYLDAKSKTKLSRMKKYYPTEKVVLIAAVQMKRIKKNFSGLIPDWETKKTVK